MRVSLLLICFFYSFLSFSQKKIQDFSADFVNNEQCATEFVHKRKMLEDKSYKTNFQSTKIRKSATSDDTYVIPIVVHVMHLGEPIGTGTNISDDQIQSAIDRINAQYGEDNSGVNTGISFCLASLDPQGQFTTGINRVNTSGVDDYSLNGITNDVGSSENEDLIKSLSNWSNLDYYNVWIVSEIDGNDGGSGTQGYAYYSSAGSYENEFDGAVIMHNSFGYDPNSDLGYNLKSYTRLNATFAHEMGHALNLKHTFEGDEGGSSCPENINCFLDGDEVCDTDPHTRNDGGCGDSGPTCIGNGTDLSDVVINYMSYSAQSCKTKFSVGQKDRMVEAILNDRSTLLQSLACTGILIFGCTDSEACNYDNLANSDDGSCEYVDAVCDTCVNGIVVDNDADNDGICDDDEIETYNCINDQCIDPGNNMGQYLSLFDCQSSCNPVIETYNCINNQCVDPGNNMGQYLSLFDCQSSCNPLSVHSYNSVKKNLVKITNMLGQEIQLLKNTTMFFIYDDGSAEKIILVE